MTLGDMENTLLFQLQQPGANFSTPMPDWSKQTNPQFNQSAIDFFVNAGYQQVLSDTIDFMPLVVYQTFASIAQTYRYEIPQPSSTGEVFPLMAKLARVLYGPLGQNYDRDYDPGTEIVAWWKYQNATARGMSQRYAYGALPAFVSLAPDRRSLYFYPGSASAGDTITIVYVPNVTPGAIIAGTLTDPSETPNLDPDYHEAIVLWALSKLWLRGREKQQSDDTRAGYENEIVKLRARHLMAHAGDTFGVKAFASASSFGDC